MDEKFIAQRLAYLRTQADVSARDMSLSMGQAANYVNNIETGKTTPSMQGFFYICDYLKISPKDFFDEGTEQPLKVKELLEEVNRLDADTLDLLIATAKKMKGKKA